MWNSPSPELKVSRGLYLPVALLVAGCNVVLPSFGVRERAADDVSDSAVAEPASDAGPSDAGPTEQSDACPGTGIEVCGGEDEDCDGAIDEGTDADLCGSAGEQLCLKGQCVAQWLRRIGGTRLEKAGALQYRPELGPVVLGSFRGTFSPGNVSLGGFDLFFAQYTDTGTIDKVWTDGGELDDIANGLHVNDTGRYTGSANVVGRFDPMGMPVLDGTTSDCSVFSFDAGGNRAWTLALGMGGGVCEDIALRSDGTTAVAALLSGSFVDGAAFFTATPTVLPLQVTPAGQRRYGFETGSITGGMASEMHRVVGLSTAGGPGARSVIAGGYVGPGLDFIDLPALPPISSNPEPASFVVWLNSDGRADALRGFSKDGFLGPQAVTITDVLVDANDRTFIGGFYVQEAGVLGLDARNSGPEAFVAQVTREGAVPWARSMGGMGDDRVLSLALHKDAVFAAGTFEGLAAFEADSVLQSAGSRDVFVVALDSATGAQQGLTQFGGALSESLHELAVGPTGQLYLMGEFSGTLDVGWARQNSLGGNDIYLASLPPIFP